MKLKIEVTEKDIENGVRLDAGNCPIHIAIARNVNNKTKFMVMGDAIEVFYENSLCAEIIELPAKVEDFVDKFDTNYKGYIKFKPFSFALCIPDQYLKKTLLKSKQVKHGKS